MSLERNQGEGKVPKREKEKILYAQGAFLLAPPHLKDGEVLTSTFIFSWDFSIFNTFRAGPCTFRSPFLILPNCFVFISTRPDHQVVGLAPDAIRRLTTG